MTKHSHSLIRALLLLTAFGLVATACAKKADDSGSRCQSNYEGTCEATKDSGMLLKAFGRYDYEVPVGQAQELKAMVVKLADGSCASGGVAAGVDVQFSIVTPNAQASLSAESATTSDAGIASVNLTADKAGTYQIRASAEGTCPVNFTIKVVDVNRGLRTDDPTELSTWTRTRKTLSVKAFAAIPGQGEMPLQGETIHITLGPGGSGTQLRDVSGQTAGNDIALVTGANGVVMFQFDSGTQAVPSGVQVTATLEGTQPVVFLIHINEYNGDPCQSNADCPSDFPICDQGTCVENNPTGDGTCTDNSDCVPPYECVQVGNDKRCVRPNTNGQRCDPIEMVNCPDGQVCIGGYCTDNPNNVQCTNNDDCPGNFICQDGVCVPDPNDTDFNCVSNTDCHNGQVCIGGICTDPSQCEPAPDPTRLQGTWHFDSTLHLRQALAGWLDGFLSAMEFFRDVIEGNLDLGLPGWVQDLIESAIQSLIDAYIPPWGQSLIVALGNISDIIDDMQVQHTVQLVATGNYEYVGTSTWDLVQFEYRGQMVSERPENIPEIGQVPTYDFTSREICYVFFIDRHEIHNVVGGLIKWVIDALVNVVTCSQGWGCYDDLESALEDLVDCDAIAAAIDDFASNAFGFDGAYDLAYQACDAGKQPAINAIVNYLDQLTVSFSILTMRGQAPIPDNDHLGDPPSNPGRWYGTLGGGNWQGEFNAVRQ